MELFLDDHPELIREFKKTAAFGARLSDDHTKWPQELNSELLKQLPYLSDYDVNVNLDRVEPQRGAAFGYADVAIKTERPEVEHAQTGIPHIRIPLVVLNGAVKPFSVFMDGSKVMPLTEERVREILFNPQTFDLSSSQPRDPSLVEALMPPQRSGIGLGGEYKMASVQSESMKRLAGRASAVASKVRPSAGAGIAGATKLPAPRPSTLDIAEDYHPWEIKEKFPHLYDSVVLKKHGSSGELSPEDSFALSMLAGQKVKTADMAGFLARANPELMERAVRGAVGKGNHDAARNLVRGAYDKTKGLSHAAQHHDPLVRAASRAHQEANISRSNVFGGAQGSVPSQEASMFAGHAPNSKAVTVPGGSVGPNTYHGPMEMIDPGLGTVAGHDMHTIVGPSGGRQSLTGATPLNSSDFAAAGPRSGFTVADRPIAGPGRTGASPLNTSEFRPTQVDAARTRQTGNRLSDFTVADSGTGVFRDGVYPDTVIGKIPGQVTGVHGVPVDQTAVGMARPPVTPREVTGVHGAPVPHAQVSDPTGIYPREVTGVHGAPVPPRQAAPTPTPVAEAAVPPPAHPQSPPPVPPQSPPPPVGAGEVPSEFGGNVPAGMSMQPYRPQSQIRPPQGTQAAASPQAAAAQGTVPGAPQGWHPGWGTAALGGAAALGGYGVASMQKQNSAMSLLEAIAPTIRESDAEAFVEKVANDYSIQAGFRRSGIAPTLVDVFDNTKRASAEERIDALADMVSPTVVTLHKLPGNQFLVKSANVHAFITKTAEGEVVPQQQVAQDIGPQAAQMQPGQTVTAVTQPVTNPQSPAPQAQPKKNNAKVVEEFGQYKVQDMMGNSLIGHVFPQTLAWDGNFTESPIALFTNGSAYAVQDTVAGEMVGKGTVLPDDAPRGDGCFYSVDNGNAVATAPVTIGSSSVGPDGQAKFMATDAFGNQMVLSQMEGFSAPQRISDNEYVLPKSWKFMRLNNQTQVIPDPVQMNKSASVRGSGGEATVIFNGAYNVVGGCGLEKISADLRHDLDYVSAEFLLGVLGVDGGTAKVKLSEARRRGHVKLSGLKSITLFTERYADAEKTASALMDEIPDLRRDLIKEAASMDDEGTVNNLLALNFINPENLATFVSYIPELEATSEKLSEMLMYSYLGMQELPEGAIERSMKNLEEVLSGLKSVANSQAGG